MLDHTAIQDVLLPSSIMFLHGCPNEAADNLGRCFSTGKRYISTRASQQSSPTLWLPVARTFIDLSMALHPVYF